jgi:hypothetical protein
MRHDPLRLAAVMFAASICLGVAVPAERVRADAPSRVQPDRHVHGKGGCGKYASCFSCSYIDQCFQLYNSVGESRFA